MSGFGQSCLQSRHAIKVITGTELQSQHEHTLSNGTPKIKRKKWRRLKMVHELKPNILKQAMHKSIAETQNTVCLCGCCLGGAPYLPHVSLKCWKLSTQVTKWWCPELHKRHPLTQQIPTRMEICLTSFKPIPYSFRMEPRNFVALHGQNERTWKSCTKRSNLSATLLTTSFCSISYAWLVHLSE